MIIRQEQFFIGEREEKGRKWVVPLNSNWTGIPDTLETETLEIPGYSALVAANSGPLRFNTENTAHYISDYRGELLEDILADLASLDSTSKLQVVQERRLLAESGQISYASLLPVIEHLTEESSYLLYQQFLIVLAGISLFVDEGTEVEAAYKKLLVTFNQFNFERLGFEPKAGETEEDEMVRQ